MGGENRWPLLEADDVSQEVDVIGALELLHEMVDALGGGNIDHGIVTPGEGLVK